MADYITFFVFSIAIPVITIILWHFFGKNEPVTPIISFEPPKNMTPAEVGFIINGTANDRDMLSLIIYWADKGYVSLDKSDKDNLRITKLTEIPHTAKNYEKTLFRALFTSGLHEHTHHEYTVYNPEKKTKKSFIAFDENFDETINLSNSHNFFVKKFELARRQLKQRFTYHVYKNNYSKFTMLLVNSTLITAIIFSFLLLPFLGSILAAIYLITAATLIFIKTSNETIQISPMFSRTSVILQFITSITSYIPVITLPIFYVNHFNLDQKYLWFIIDICFIMFIVNSFCKKLVDDFYVTKEKMFVWQIIFFISLNLLLGGAIIYFANKLNCSSIMIFPLLCTYISIYFSLLMKKRSSIGQKYLNEIVGLRDFIEMAENEKLEFLTNNDPDYFYHIFPFAYALGLSDIWSDKFENISLEITPTFSLLSFLFEDEDTGRISDLFNDLLNLFN